MTIFEPYAHQVAGHCSILKLDGMVCKPLIPRECEFYQTVYREFPPLIPLTPEFHGSIAIRNPKPSTQEQTISDKYTIHRNPSLKHNRLNITTLPHCIPSSNICSEYIVLQDLTAGMSKPCAMDMKVGTRQRFTTSTLLGFRLCGMRVHRWTGLYSVDRLFGRGLTPDTVEDAVAAFLFDGDRVRTELIPSILDGLQRIITVLEDPTLPFRFYTSSLLFIYEGDQQETQGKPPHVELRIIDFAHAIPKADKEGEGDDGFLFGLRNLSILFRNIAAHHAPPPLLPHPPHPHSDPREHDHNVPQQEHDVSDDDDDESRWKLERARERDFITNRCTPISPFLLTSTIKADNY